MDMNTPRDILGLFVEQDERYALRAELEASLSEIDHELAQTVLSKKAVANQRRELDVLHQALARGLAALAPDQGK